MRVLIFWDSIAEWYYDCEKWWWPNRLKTSYWNTDRTREIWLAWICWDTAEDIIRRLEFTTKDFIEKFKEDVSFIFAVWINDSALINMTSELYNIKVFQENIEIIINMSQKFQPKNITFLWLTSVDENLTNPLIVSKTWKCYQNDRIREFNAIIKSTAKKEKCDYIDVIWLLNDDDLDDGIHPNAKWHEKIFKHVQNYLELS